MVGEKSLPTDSSKAVTVDNVTKMYDGNIKALSGISLSIEKGTIYALLGPNGAGKSTMISLLITLIPLTGGSIHINGFDVSNEEELVRREIGVTFQEMVLDEVLTGRQILIYHGRLYSMSRKEAASRAEELLKLVELEDAADRRCKTYSGGMKRKLELARALMTVPKVLFLDEPTLGLDPTSRTQIWGYVRNLVKNNGLTVLLTTHYLDEAQKLADCVGILDKGHLVAEGSPDKLIEELGSDTVLLRGKGPHERLLQKFKSLQYVQSVSTVKNGLLLGVESSAKNLAGIIAEADKIGFFIEEVAVSKPDLGAVFAKYTGHKLQEEVRS